MKEVKEVKNKILIVEDDPNFGSVLKDYLTIYDFDVTLAKNGVEGLEKFKKRSYDICILDVMMPYKDGFTLAEEIREIDSDVSIIFLTAKSLKEDMLRGYKVGADDYLTKPFDSEVLLFKLKAILQRKKDGVEEVSDEHIFQLGKFTFNSRLRQLSFEGEKGYEVLSPKENKLLKLLVLNKDDLMKREHALTKVWKEENYFTSRSMDVYIVKLRKHLKKDPNIELLNIHSEGFMLVVRS